MVLPGFVSAQTDTPAAALGRSIGTLLGNIFSNSGNSGQSESYQSLESSSSSVASDVPNNESVSIFRTKDEQIIEQIKAVCARQDLKVFYEKTPCNNSELSMSHFVDESKVTVNQKKVILIIDEEYKKIADMQAENYRSNVKPQILGNQLADSRTKFRVASQKLLQDLYMGKINWGQYNSGRRDIAQERRNEFMRLTRQAGF